MMSSSMDICGLLNPYHRHRHHHHHHNSYSCPAAAYERMKCACLDTSGGSCTSYERVPSVPALLDVRFSALRSRDDSEEKDASNEKQEELVFFNDDGSYQTVVVEKNLCASDLCQLLALKNRVAKDVNWTIVEHWIEFGLERSLEDHEDVLSVYHDMQTFGRQTEKRFIFRKDFRKYEFFHNPQQFFPPDMVDLNGCEELAGNSPLLDQTAALQTLLANAGECPPIFSHVWVREANKQVWNKGFLLLKNKKLYLSFKIQVVAKFLRSKDTPGTSKDRVSTLSQMSDQPVRSASNCSCNDFSFAGWELCNGLYHTEEL
ncbi:growth factor receptor-bound protein 10 [Anabrus simplex]|uniref:growth factor receptor-bound protein 10 n=1 Tax=Anabrus simplex TaxID=316456 RepID=UPI0035A2BDCF